MVQTQTKISIKDNSDFLQGQCINFAKKNTKKAAKIGNCVKVSILKVKPTAVYSQEYKKAAGGKTSMSNTKKNSLQDLLLVQVKAPTCRKDGSTIQFYSNCGVCVVFKKAGANKQHQLGFKRVNTTVPFELKNKVYAQQFKAAYNVIKVAKNLL
uniref:Ribosomal protein L14 n=2 Tax=Ulva TaxID=3118 RepID=A0A0U2K6K0_ULVPR|nr:ribosomal protein L14 [Ulva prolifera]YP_009239269.1 ribsomal protein L14 [Ulva linza]ALN38266.1 ribosomal protein L14 [Ulva prolifera]AML80554.1 ribsomal protein L14 [Ulva prolifera]AML80592.1 ribsomal protein L14 [Ulva linza]QZJ45959.1 ribosomal protein L14 [Ulva prolifera]